MLVALHQQRTAARVLTVPVDRNRPRVEMKCIVVALHLEWLPCVTTSKYVSLRSVSYYNTPSGTVVKEMQIAVPSTNFRGYRREFYAATPKSTYLGFVSSRGIVCRAQFRILTVIGERVFQMGVAREKFMNETIGHYRHATCLRNTAVYAKKSSKRSRNKLGLVRRQ